MLRDVEVLEFGSNSFGLKSKNDQLPTIESET
jgi:hypothetical protein